jgi:ketosteroid isomerase-like protein
MDAVMESWSDDIRWEGSTDERIPGGGKHDGKEDTSQVFGRIRENFETFSAPGDEFLEEDNTVVVLGHQEGKTKGGKDFKVPFVHIWRMENGEAKRAQLLTDTAVIVEALEG